MAFWSDLGKKISDTTQSVVEKTKISTDTMRLNGLISDEERNVQRIYAEIGRKYMELHGADGDPDFAGLMQEYQTSKAKMEEYRSQIRRNKHLLICAGCGAEIPETVLYCTRCGAENPVGKRLAEEQRQREEAERAAREADLQAACCPADRTPSRSSVPDAVSHGRRAQCSARSAVPSSYRRWQLRRSHQLRKLRRHRQHRQHPHRSHQLRQLRRHR